MWCFWHVFLARLAHAYTHWRCRAFNYGLNTRSNFFLLFLLSNSQIRMRSLTNEQRDKIISLYFTQLSRPCTCLALFFQLTARAEISIAPEYIHFSSRKALWLSFKSDYIKLFNCEFIKAAAVAARVCSPVCLSLKNCLAINFRSIHCSSQFSQRPTANPSTCACQLRLGLSTHIFVAHSNHEISSFEIHFGDSRPVVMSHRWLVPQHNDSARRQAQEVLDAIFALDMFKSVVIHTQCC